MPTPGTSAVPFWRRPVVLALAAAMVTGLLLWWIYAPLFGASFLRWDDGHNITRNPLLSGDTSWTEMWARPWFGLYIPVTLSIWRALLDLGAGAVPFRVFNVVVHGFNAALVALLTWRLSRYLHGSDGIRGPHERARLMGAAIAALLFAVHPLQVGAVGWISGGRDLGATCCALLAVVVLGTSAVPTGIALAVSSVLFTAGLLCKPSIAAVPLVMGLVAVLLQASWRRRFLAATFIWSVPTAAVTIITARTQMEMTPLDIPIGARLIGAVDAIGFYVTKVWWPAPLQVDYGRIPAAIGGDPSTWQPSMMLTVPLALALFIAIGAGVVFARAGTSAPALQDASARVLTRWSAVAIVCAIVTAAPVLGVIPFSFQRISTVADHYMYLPLVPITIVVGLTAGRLFRSQADSGLPSRASRGPLSAPAIIVMGVVAVALALLTATARRHVADYRDDAALFSAVLDHQPTSVSALSMIGMMECSRGDLVAGTAKLARAMELAPSRPTVLANYAFCLYQGGHTTETLALMARLDDPLVQGELDRDDEPAGNLLNTLAGALFQEGNLGAGWPLLCQASVLAPRETGIMANLEDIAAQAAESGFTLQCPPRVSWEVLLRVVRVERGAPR
ncbi:hypothetical protein [Gemmatimonas aurantiaca]|uniref:hypothetical protein n=1 Tax=Gemmatimonas aurantiaca TaxID=173480 RepID=UPI00301E5E21